MARLAWFSPMPPARSGVAVYSAEVVAALRAAHQVQVFVDDPVAAAARAARRPLAEVRSAHDFVWLHRLQPYDLTVFQLGNSSAHDFIWPYLSRYPGLAVLHDAHLHHARAATLLRQQRPQDYRREFTAAHPEASPDAAEIAIHGFDSHLYYQWPMIRGVVERSRLTAVHSAPAADALRAQYPDARIAHIRLGHGEPVSAAARALARQHILSRHGIPGDSVLFGVFGGLSPEKRITPVLAALAATRRYAPAAHLLLVGAPAGHYDVAGEIRRHGLDAAVTLTGYVEDAAFTSYLAACDVTLNLRWPTAREISGPWARALAAGCATVTTDLWHTADVPGLDPRTWTVAHASASLEAPPPVSVRIDILDEDHSLQLAMRRLALDAGLRAQLAGTGVAWWQAHHTSALMAADYARVIDEALQTPAAAPPPMPAWAETLLTPFGLGDVFGRSVMLGEGVES